MINTLKLFIDLLDGLETQKTTNFDDLLDDINIKNSICRFDQHF